MQCKNHPQVEATARCAGCAEAFCADCLVEIQGKKYCGNCKVMALSGRAPLSPENETVPCKEADEALKYAIVGIFCFGVILGPLAISKAHKAKKMIEADPHLMGAGKATAALWLGWAVLILWVLGIISRMSGTR